MSSNRTASTQKPKSHQKTPPKHAQVKGSKPVKPNLTWIIPLAIVVVAAIITAILLTNKKAPGVAETLPVNIGVTEAADRFEAGAYLLDVRTVGEWNESHVDGAVLIPLNELSSRTNEIPTDKDVLIICRSGNRSTDARNLLRAAGLPRTTSITGGINSWIAAGLPVVTGP